MKAFRLTYKRYGNNAILIEWPKKIDKKILLDILNFKKKLSKKYIKVKVEITHAYNSISIIYYNSIENIYNEISALKKLYKSQDTQNKINTKLWKIPVCYDQKFGIDLDEISKENKLPKTEIITLHSRPTYTVFFIGFLPGFLYLGGLNKKLHFSRKTTPRLQVQKGAVGIGGSQTGIYPQESAGGWNIIGNSPVSFLDRKNSIPCFAKAGDLIKFIPISLDEYNEISNLVAYKRYKIESEVVNA